MYCESCRQDLHKITELRDSKAIKQAILYSSMRPQSPQTMKFWAGSVVRIIDKVLENMKVYDINFENIQKCLKGSEEHRVLLYLENLLHEEGVRLRQKLGIDCDPLSEPNDTNQRIINYINSMETGNETEEEGEEVLCGEMG